MASHKSRPNPRILLEHQAASLMRKKRRISGDFTITSVAIPHHRVREFIAEMLEKDPHEAHTPTIDNEKNKHRRLQLTATGRWHHSIFRPFPKPWEALSKGEQERLYKYFTKAAKDHAHELQAAPGGNRHWTGLLGGQVQLAKNHVEDVKSGLRIFRRYYGEPNDIILREAEKYETGWRNLHSILEAIFKRATQEN